MTDNEIIKALEDYKNSKILQTENGVISIGDILDLIKRQKAEIERLRELLSIPIAEEDEDWFSSPPLKTPEQIKSEAIKEFAERLKAEYVDFDELHEEIRHDNLILAVDNLVKEMTEGNG